MIFMVLSLFFIYIGIEIKDKNIIKLGPFF